MQTKSYGALLALLFCSCQSHSTKTLTPFALPAGAEILTLKGNWEFCREDPKTPPAHDLAGGTWQVQPVPGFWSQQDHPALGLAWYRTAIELPAGFERTQNWALSLRQVFVAAEIYWDGREIARHGRVGATPSQEQPAWDDHIYLIPVDALLPGPHELALRVSNQHWFSGGITIPPEFGRYDALFESHESRTAWHGLLAGFFLLFGISHLILFLYNSKQREYLLLAVMSFNVTAMVVLFELPDLLQLNVHHFDARVRAIWVMMMLAVVLMYRFLTRQFDYNPRALTLLVLGGSGLMLLPICFPGEVTALRSLVPWRDYWFQFALFVGVYVIFWAVRHKRPGSSILAGGVVPLVLAGTYSSIKFESIWAFLGFGFFIMAMSISLSRKVAGISREVQRARDVFRLFVPEQLLDKIAKRGLDSIKLGSAEEGTATVLFTDIRSFTTIAEKLSPGETLSFLNDFMQRMSPVIHEHGGFICQFVGDEIMVIFYMPEQAAAAVRCAVAMRRALEEHNRVRVELGGQALEIGIGINTGRVILGTIGSDTRMESCVIGDTVNLASRIQSLTKRYNVKVLISEATLQALPALAQVEAREVEVVQVKGKTRPVVIYEIIEGDSITIATLKKQSLSAYQEGLQYFRAQQWQAAHASFAACVQLTPEDEVARMYLSRSEDFLRMPPPGEWRGVTVLQEK